MMQFMEKGAEARDRRMYDPHSPFDPYCTYPKRDKPQLKFRKRGKIRRLPGLSKKPKRDGE
jgi:hypothetical protein